jgi:hypothetical protein
VLSKIRVGIVAILLALPAFAVGPKSLTNSQPFTDPAHNALANGATVFQLANSDSVVGGPQLVQELTSTVTLDGTGKVSSSPLIWAADTLQSTGNHYIVNMYNSNGSKVRGSENWRLSGISPIDLSLQVNATLPDPGLSNPVLQNPVASQTIIGQSLSLTTSAPSLVGKLNNCRVVDPSTYLTNWPGSTTSGIQEAINDAATANANVCLDVGTYTITSTIAPKANVSMFCSGRGTKITQANGANLAVLFDTSINTATNGAVYNCYFDGNWLSSSTGSPIAVTVNNIGTTAIVVLTGANGFIFQNNWVENSNGHCVWMSSFAASDVQNVKVRNNHIRGCFGQGIHGIGGNSTLQAINGVIQDNDIQDWGGFGIGIQLVKNLKITHNKTLGTAIYANTTLSGTSVRWVSGTQFDTAANPLRPGQVLRYAGDAVDYVIATVNSATSATVQAGSTNHTNVASRLGNLEGYNLDGTNAVKLRNNEAHSTIDSGFVFVGFLGPSLNNEVVGNFAIKPATAGFSIDGGASFIVKGTQLVGNMTVDPNQAQIGGFGYQIASANAISNIIQGNWTYDDGPGFTTGTVNITAAGAGNCESNNFGQGWTNPAPSGDFPCPYSTFLGASLNPNALLTISQLASTLTMFTLEKRAQVRFRFCIPASADQNFHITSADDCTSHLLDVTRGGDTGVNRGLWVNESGSCTMSSGTCSAQGLTHTYRAAPRCFANWTGSGTLTGLLKVPSTTTTVTPASSVGTDTAVVNWECHLANSSF